MHIKNKIGPSTDPCGAPLKTADKERAKLCQTRKGGFEYNIFGVKKFHKYIYGRQHSELGTNWVLCVLLCGSHVGCPHGTQLILATCFTKVPIGLTNVWAERGCHMGLMCVFPLF